MARYFMHLRDSIDETLDPEGIEMPAAEVVGVTLMAARDFMSGDVKAGRLDLATGSTSTTRPARWSIACPLRTRWRSFGPTDGAIARRCTARGQIRIAGSMIIRPSVSSRMRFS